MEGLRAVRGEVIVRERVAAGRPTLGICVGMQILFSQGVEHGNHSGVGIWSAKVEKLNAPILPHMGWNTVNVAAQSQLLKGLETQSFYFVHSYAVKQVSAPIVSTAHHGEDFIAAIEDGVVSATQFHPEKSGEAGLQLIRNWVDTL
jgi:glutamine amidotransferase